MKHGKTNQIAWRRFLFDNAEELILGTVFLIGLFFGLLSGQAETLVSSGRGDSFLRLFLRTVFPIALFFFASFFCGTSPFGVISPLLLLFYGFAGGVSLHLFMQAETYLHYLLFCFPTILLSTVLLICQIKYGLSLSLHLFQLCTGGGAADLSVKFRSFLWRCLIGFSVVAAGSLLFSAIRFYITS